MLSDLSNVKISTLSMSNIFGETKTKLIFHTSLFVCFFFEMQLVILKPDSIFFLYI